METKKREELFRTLDLLILAHATHNPALLKDLLTFKTQLDDACRHGDVKRFAEIAEAVAAAIKSWLDWGP